MELEKERREEVPRSHNIKENRRYIVNEDLPDDSVKDGILKRYFEEGSEATVAANPVSSIGSKEEVNRAQFQSSCSNRTAEEDQLGRDYNNLNKEKDQILSNYTRVAKDREQLQNSYKNLDKEMEQLQTSYNNLQNNLINLTLERDNLEKLYNNISKEKAQLQISYNNLTKERDQLQTSRNHLAKECHHAQMSLTNLTSKRDKLLKSYSNMSKDRDELQTSYNNLTKKRNHLQTSYNSLLAKQLELKSNMTQQREQLVWEKGQLQGQVQAMAKEKTDLQAKLQANEVSLRNLMLEKTKLNTTLKIIEQEAWVYFKGSFYYVSSTKDTWNNSRNYCRQKDSDLLVIDSLEEQVFANRFQKYVWIGLTDSEKEGTWRWVDGTVPNTRYWSTGEPNGRNTENCGDIKTYNAEQSWNDEGCNTLLLWICEKKFILN